MKKFLSKVLMLVMVFMTFITLTVFAGTADIQFGDPTTTRGKTFELVIKVKSKDVKLSTADLTVKYEADKLEFVDGTDAEGGSGMVRINGKGKGSGTTTLEYRLKFNAISAGKTSVTLENFEVTDQSDNPVNIEHKGSSNVNIKSASTTSKNANLKSLEVQPGELEQEFNAETLEYSCEVNSDVDQIVINAYPEDSDAKVEVKGNEALNVGENLIEINVTAPNNKNNKTYVLKVTKLETGITPGGSSIIDGQRIISEKYYVAYMPFPDDTTIFDGYVETTAYIFNNELTVWVEKDNNDPQYCIFYGMDQQGDTGFYRYDKYKYTIQRYFADPKIDELKVKAENEALAVFNYNKIKDKYNVLLIACGILALLCVILIIVTIVAITKKSKKQSYKEPDDFDDVDEEDDAEFFAPRNARASRIKNDRPVEKIDDADDDMIQDNIKDDKYNDSDIQYDNNDDQSLDVEDLE